MVLASIGFIMYKFDDLFLPYFWDELAGYVSGIFHMVDNGVSLLPSAVPPELSYGHPLFMHAFMATCIKLFGDDVYILHSITLLFTLLLAYGVYLLSLELISNKQIAVFSFLIFLVQPIVLAQSTQVLLEVLLALLSVYAILFYLRKNYIVAAIFCTLAVMTKETGLVLAIAFITHVLVQIFILKNKQYGMKQILVSLLPIAVFAVFLIIQKQTYGWYLNPTNVGKTKLNLGSMLQKTWDYSLEFTFVNQGRFVYSIVLFLSIVLWLFKHRLQNIKLRALTGIIPVFLFGFIVFSSIADALERYFLLLIPFAAIGFSWAIDYSKSINRRLPFILLLICFIFSLKYMKNDDKYCDSDMGYRHLVRTNQMVFDYVNSGEFKGKTVNFAFPLNLAPIDSRYGYFDTLNFIPDTSVLNTAKYKVYCMPGNLDWNMPDSHSFTPLKTFTSGYSKAVVYKRIE
jgi:hypothetical protein